MREKLRKNPYGDQGVWGFLRTIPANPRAVVHPPHLPADPPLHAQHRAPGPVHPPCTKPGAHIPIILARTGGGSDGGSGGAERPSRIDQPHADPVHRTLWNMVRRSSWLTRHRVMGLWVTYARVLVVFPDPGRPRVTMSRLTVSPPAGAGVSGR